MSRLLSCGRNLALYSAIRLARPSSTIGAGGGGASDADDEGGSQSSQAGGGGGDAGPSESVRFLGGDGAGSTASSLAGTPPAAIVERASLSCQICCICAV